MGQFVLALLTALAVLNAPLDFLGQARAQTTSEKFYDFLQSQWPQARAAGVSRATFDSAIEGLTLDASLTGLRPNSQSSTNR